VNIKRWVWLEVAVLPASKKPRVNPAINRHYIPHEIIDHIPSYKSQLKAELASLQGDDEPVLRDNTPRDPQTVSKAIRFLTSGHLTPLDASVGDCQRTLDSLVDLYDFADDLSIESLRYQTAFHIFKFLRVTNLAIFLAFARRYYNGSGDDLQHTSIGFAIKMCLNGFLPRLQQIMTNDQISSEGGILGKQLMVVLLEGRDKKVSTSGSGTEVQGE